MSGDTLKEQVHSLLDTDAYTDGTSLARLSDFFGKSSLITYHFNHSYPGLKLFRSP